MEMVHIGFERTTNRLIKLVFDEEQLDAIPCAPEEFTAEELDMFAAACIQQAIRLRTVTGNWPKGFPAQPRDPLH